MRISDWSSDVCSSDLFLWRREADTDALAALPEKDRTTQEMSGREVFDRLAGTWAYWGWKGGYFDSEADASAYFDEMRFMLAAQIAAPNSPQWFNTGLHWAYGKIGRASCRERVCQYV